MRKPEGLCAALTPIGALGLAVSALTQPLPRAAWGAEVLVEQVHQALSEVEGPAARAMARLVLGTAGRANVGVVRDTVGALVSTGVLRPEGVGKTAVFFVPDEERRRCRCNNGPAGVLDAAEWTAVRRGAHSAEARFVAWSKTAAALPERNSGTVTSAETRRQAVR